MSDTGDTTRGGKADGPSRSVGTRVARSAATIVAARFIVRALGIVNTLVLARLLTPADFGVVALGVTMMQLLYNVSDVGVAQTVVKYRRMRRRVIDTLFTLNVSRGILLFALLAGLAPFADQFFGDERVTLVFVAMGGVVFFRSLVNPRYYEFERDLDFSREFMISVIVKVLAVAISIAVALIFRTYWAIVLGLAVGELTMAILSYLVVPHRSRLTFTGIRDVRGFTGWLMGVSALRALNLKLETLIVGRFLSAGITGAFYVGKQLAEIAGVELATPIARAIYPGLSTFQHDPRAMRDAYLSGAQALAAVAMPAAVGLGFLAEDIVALFLDDRWQDAVRVIQVIAPVDGLLVVFYATQGLAMAMGRVRDVFIREVIFLFINIPALVIATMLYGLDGTLGAIIGTCLIFAVLESHLYAKVTGDRMWAPIWAVRRSLLAVGAMSVWFFVLKSPLGVDALPIAVRIVIDVAMGGAFYGAAHLGLWMAEGRPGGVERRVLDMLPVRG